MALFQDCNSFLLPATLADDCPVPPRQPKLESSDLLPRQAAGMLRQSRRDSTGKKVNIDCP